MSRRFVAVGAALLLALFGTGAMFAYVSNADDRALEGQKAVTVLMAAKEIAAGTTAQDAKAQGLVRSERMPSKAVPDDALRSLDGVSSLVATSTIASGELLTRSRFGTKAVASGGLSVPKGKLALSVELEDPARVGGFVQVGSQIAVYDTFNVNEAKSGDTPAGDHISDNHDYTRATRVLLPKVTVLAVGDSTKPSSGTQDKTTDSATTAILTVAVTPGEATKLVHGIQTGTLYLGLLGGSTDLSHVSGLNDRNLFG